MTAIPRLLCTAALCWATCALAVPLELAGVTVEPTAQVAGVPLELNGAGIRYKGPFKINVTGLYAPKKFSSLEELLAQPGPKRASLIMLREVPSDLVGKTLVRGIEDNYPKAEMSKVVPSLIRISAVFNANKTLNPGDRILIDWIPGTGTVVTVRGVVQGEPFKEPEFFHALVSIWLGPVPVDFKLKDALLGQK